jgi:glycosyltransferase involved in cell wall biosynthesis
MKIVIWNAHWDTLGGGEVYAGYLADFLSRKDFPVSIVGLGENPVKKLQERLGIDLKNVTYIRIPSELFLHTILQKEDLFVNGSYGSAFTSPTKRSVYICHFPFNSAKRKILGKVFFKKVTLAISKNGSILHPIDNSVLLLGQGDILTNNPITLDFKCEFGKAKLTDKHGLLVHLDTGIQESLKIVDGISIDFEGMQSSVLTVNGLPNLGPLKRFIISRVWIGNNFPDSYSQIWANSDFTKTFVKKYWDRNSIVVFPPHFERELFVAKRDPYSILSIGRFMSPRHGHSKNQLKLIEAFDHLRSRSEKPWSLHLAGGVGAGNGGYFEKAKALALRKNLNVFFYPNCTQNELNQLLGTATYYWHGTGWGVSHRKPQNMEHFGISVVEAMNAGLIPIVFDLAGPAEILKRFPNLRFTKKAELAAGTINLSDSEIDGLKKELTIESLRFSTSNFESKALKSLQALLKN